MQIVGDDYVSAKCPSQNFRIPSGERVERIPMGKSAKEAAKNLMAAFNNKQPETYPASEGGVVLIKKMDLKTGKFSGKALKVTRK